MRIFGILFQILVVAF